MFYHGLFLSFFFFLFFYSSATHLTLWTQLNHIRPHGQKKVWFENACLKCGYPFSLQIRGSKTTFFRRFRNLRANFTAYIFGMKHDIHKQANALKTTRGFLCHLKTTWTLVHKQLQTVGEFSPTLHFIARLHKLCQTVDGKSCKQSAIEKLGSSLCKKLGAEKNFCICSVFDDFET